MNKWLIICMIAFSGCYSFRGISIPDDVKYYRVDEFENQTETAVPTYPITFTERLKDKIRTESRLIYRPDSADVVFRGSVIEFSINSLAPQANDRVAFNQLRITVRVEYENTKNEKQNWKQNISFQQQFPATVNFLDVQDDLIRQINDQLVEDIFNKAFTDW